MKTFNKPHDNLGGVLKVWAIPPDIVSVSGNSLSFTSTINIVEMYATAETLNANVKSTHSEAGLIHEIDISGSIPRSLSNGSENVDYLMQRRWIVLIEDGNNNFLFYGVPKKERLKFECEEDTGKSTSDGSIIKFRFYGSTTQRPKSVSNPF